MNDVELFFAEAMGGQPIDEVDPDVIEALIDIYQVLVLGQPLPEPTPEEMKAQQEKNQRDAERSRYRLAQDGVFYGERWKQVDEDEWRKQYGDPWADAPQ